MKRHAKAASAGSISSRGNGLGSIRRAFVIRDGSPGSNGSSAFSADYRRPVIVLGFALLLCTLAMALSGGAEASKVVYDFVGSSSTGTIGGQFSTPRGIAVNAAGTGGASAGDVYVVDSSNNRIQQLSATGAFIRAFGRDVITTGKANDNGTGFEICDTTAGNVATDCKAGVATPAEGGTLSSPQGIAINQSSGHLYVTNQGFLRIDEFDATGHFVRAFGQDVVSAGPGNAPAAAAKQTLTVDATAGQFKLSFRGQTTADIAFDAPATGAGSVQAALQALPTIVSGNLSVTGGPGGPGGATPYVITFSGLLSNAPMPLISTVTGTTPLSGGAGASLANTTSGATGYEVCNSPVDTCKTGVSASTAGAFLSTFAGHIAVAPTGAPNVDNVLVADPGNRRVNEYTSAGVFVRSFGWDTVSSGPSDSAVNEQQTLTVQADGGTFTLSFNPGPGSQTTGAIKYDASAAEVEAALNGLGNMVASGARVFVSGGPGNATGSAPYTITFSGLIGGEDVAQMTSSATGLTLTTGTKSATVTTIAPGGAFEICRAASFDVCKVGGASGSAIGQFATNGPSRIAIDSTGAIYTVEQNVNARVQKLTPTGPNLAPSLFTPTFLTGTGAPTDIAIGASNSIFITKACAAATNCPNPPSGEERRVYEFSSAGSLLDAHIAGAGINSANGLAANPAISRLYVSSITGGHRVYIIVNSPSQAPSASTDAATPGTTDYSYTLEGTLNPQGFKVSKCRFLYGTSAEYDQEAPCVPGTAALGDGIDDIAVSATTAPLEPNTVYHYRLVAANAGQSATGKDRTFTTGPAPADSCANADIRAAQGIEVTLLPNCMALEQVSPANKANQSARRFPAAPVSADGNRVLFGSVATLGACPNVHGIGGDTFIAVRDQADGWNTKCVTPPIRDDTFASNEDFPTQFTPDLSHWFQLARASDNLFRVFQEGFGGVATVISPPLLLSDPETFTPPEVQGATADRSTLYFTPSGPRQNFYLPGDPSPAGQGEDSDLYATHLDADGQPSIELIARDRDGKIWGANCGARLGGIESTTGNNLNLLNGFRAQGAISTNGSRVYFSTRPAQPASGDCTEANKKRIMVRDATPSGPKIEELISSECDRVSPACSTTDGDDVFQGSSNDQTRVYFTTTRQLVDTDLDANATSCNISTAVSGCDLYLYDSTRPASERLTQVSAGGDSAATPGEGASVRNGITAISRDGSHVYFVARTVLTTDPNSEGQVAQTAQDNLYLYTYPQEDISFVGSVAPGDGGSLFGGEGAAYPVPVMGADAQGKEVGGDGHILLFKSKAPLTADDTDGDRTDIFRFDGDAGTLDRVSKAGPGGSDNGSFDAITPGGAPGTVTDYAERGRWVSEDGEEVVFTSKEPLLAGDTNGAEDSYLWRDGQLFHLPGSSRSSESAAQIFPGLSHDGSTIAYHSTKRLVSTDGDSVEDVYVLRADGGFRTPVRAECEGEACQGAPSTHSAEIGATTGSFAGAGNVESQGPKARGCPKGKHKVRRKGKARCVSTSNRSHKKHNAKRTSTKQGGQK